MCVFFKKNFCFRYVDANGPLFANISAIACQSFSDGLKSDRPSLRSLAFVEQEINEMVFGNLQNSRYFFEKLPDSHPLIQVSGFSTNG
jgi:hypothetical protein